MSTATRWKNRLLLPALLALTLAEGAASGCAGRPASPARSRQEGEVRVAVRAAAAGRLGEAIAAQQRALLAARSVEDVEGIALRILDLSALHRAAGQPREAAAALGELLAEPPPLDFPVRWRSEAARLAGLLALDAGDAGTGARWAARALELCLEAGCPGRGAIVNLQARAAFLAGDLSGAVRLASQALALNLEESDPAERANSSRILADAELARGRHGAASAAYADALEIDKKLGLDAKILVDLAGLGRSTKEGGRPREAREWLERALAVARASGDAAAAAGIESLLESVPAAAP